MFIKYSVGGAITSVEDKDGIEQREVDDTEIKCEGAMIATCKCGMQHMLMKEEVRVCCCGNSVAVN
jgi:hypothetical protein